MDFAKNFVKLTLLTLQNDNKLRDIKSKDSLLMKIGKISWNQVKDFFVAMKD